MTEQIFVTNRNDFYHVDHYDGQEYAFPKGERVLIPEDAAALMLGFGNPDKTDTLLRLGWTGDDGVKKLAGFVFTKGKFVEEEVSAPTVREEPSIQLTQTA